MPEPVKTELQQRYLSRSALFWKFVKDAKFSRLQHLARSASWKKLDWNWQALGITLSARTAAESFGFVPTEVFAHPIVVQEHPELFDYYRLLACLPNKGLSQIKTDKKTKDFVSRCVLLNSFISELLSGSSHINRHIVLCTIFAEAGSEWQGTWVNKNSDSDLICVIEIKGSADKAGAQTRLGETKKSFTKAKLENPRCVTIFLPSILTPAVRKQLQTERDIDKVFNLIELFNNKTRREEFLEELFKYILREKN